MQPLSAELLAAQRSASALPVVDLRAVDYDVGAPRLRWTQWHADAPPVHAGPAAAAVTGAPPAAGWALLRARVDAATGALEVQRVVEADAAADYTAWTALGTVHAAAGVALAAAGARALLATAAPGGTAVQVRESADGGATWGAAQTVCTTTAAAAGVAVALRADGGALCAAADAATVRFVTRPAPGAWGAAQTWTHTLATVSGVAALAALDYALVVSGVDAAGRPGVWTAVYGIGNAAPPGMWLALQSVVRGSAGTQVGYRAPGVMLVDVPRVSFVETHQGVVAQHRAHLATAVAGTSIDEARWREPLPLPVIDAAGVALAAASGGAWFVTGAEVWHAPVDLQPVDLGGALVALEVTRALDAGALRATFDADAAPAGAAGAAGSALQPGGELWLDIGYQAGAGPSIGSSTRWQIRAVRRRRRAGRALIEVEAVDGWGLLGAWRAARMRTWDGTADGQVVLTDLLELVGLRLSVGVGSGELSAVTPRLVLRPGERAAAAVGRVLERIPDLTVMRGFTAAVVGADPAAPADYHYGTDHPLLAVEVEERSPGAGWARAFGDATFAEAVDLAALARGAPVAVAVDADLVAQPRAEARAAAVLVRDRRARRAGRITVRANVGQEPGDVVEVTDPLLSEATARFRVREVVLRYEPDRGRYESELALGEV